MKYLMRIGWAILMIFLVATLTFFLVRIMPGNPIQVKFAQLVYQGLSTQQAAQEVQTLYNILPSGSLWSQYLSYLGGLLHGNLGQSISYTGEPVMRVIMTALPWTVFLVVSGLLVSFVLGVVLGVWAAMRRNHLPDTLVTTASTVLHGIPQYVSALAIAYLLTTVWPIFPFGGTYQVGLTPGINLPFIGSVLVHSVLPVFSFVLSGFGAWALTMKATTAGAMGEDYILAANVRGLGRARVFYYVGRNAILPVFTQFALAIGFMFSGAIFVESIFDLPGLGNMINSAVSNRDYPLMQGTFLIISIAVIVANLLADVLYRRLDPRIQS
jgi:peptide/nickel transport system permease protein